LSEKKNRRDSSAGLHPARIIQSIFEETFDVITPPIPNWENYELLDLPLQVREDAYADAVEAYDSMMSDGPELKKWDILSERFSHFGTSGYRNYKKRQEFIPDLLPFDNEWLNRGVQIYGEEDRSDWLYEKLGANRVRVPTGLLPDHASPTDIAFSPSMEKAIPDLYKQKAWADFIGPALLRFYREEEAFMTNKSEDLYQNISQVPMVIDEDDSDDAKKKRVENVDFSKFWTNFSLKNSLEAKTLTAYLSRTPGMRDVPLERFFRILFKLSSHESFNSIERMQQFILNSIVMYDNISASSKLSMDLLAVFFKDKGNDSLKSNAILDTILEKISGTKKEKIIKLLYVANLLESFSDDRVLQELISSKYLDKIQLNIIREAISSWIDISKNQDAELADKAIQFQSEIGPEKVIFTSELISLLKTFAEPDSLDGFIDKLFNYIPSKNKDAIFDSIRYIIRQIKYAQSIISQSEQFKQYYKLAEKKEESLFKANLHFPGEKWRFRVLNDLDPYHFQVGADSNCCQVIGGMGASAAVDSFINKYAGVVILETITADNDWVLVSQSYFHYVPSDFSKPRSPSRSNTDWRDDSDSMIILDNIETSPHAEEALRSINYTADELYSLLAKHLEDQGIGHVLVGKAYTRIINHHKFDSAALNSDPRVFMANDPYTGEPYTDFNIRESIDLLSPKFDLTDDRGIDEKRAKHTPLKLDIIKSGKISSEIIFSSMSNPSINSLIIKKLSNLCKWLEENHCAKDAHTLRMLKTSALITNLKEEAGEEIAGQMSALEDKYFPAYYAQDSEDILDDFQQPGAAGVIFSDDDDSKVKGYLYGYQLVFEDEMGGRNIYPEELECFEDDCSNDPESFSEAMSSLAQKGQIFYVSNFLIDKGYRLRIVDLIEAFTDEVKSNGYEYIAFDALSDTYNLIMKDGMPHNRREERFGIKVLAKIENLFIARLF
tara:strand:- start:8303 stop:11149 length:2847 start_codon:yes stop_codon:yes gene_type:complete